jgi:uncharacterized protein (DUF2267 family)
MDRVRSIHQAEPLSSRSTRKAARHASRAGATYARFVDAVSNAGPYAHRDAEDYTVAVIATLEELLPFSDIANLEAQLPSILGSVLNNIPILDLPTMKRHLFCSRVATRAGVTRVDAEAITSVVFTVLRSRISAGEARRIEELLSPDLRAIWHGNTAHLD